MTQKANFFKLGLFVIIAFSLGAAFLILFGAGQFFKKELLVETCFNESVQGLSIGSEVKYKGIKIGTVKTITSAAQVYQAKSDYVLVIISLEDSLSLGQTGEKARDRIQNAIRDGLTIRLAFKGLTGVAYLETDYSAQDAGAAERLDISWTPKTIYIPSQKSNMKQFGDAINLILDNLAAINLKGIALNIETLLTTLDQKINALDMDHLSSLVLSLITDIKQTNQVLGKVIGSDRIQNLLSDAQASFSTLRSIVETSKVPLNKAITDFQKTARSTKQVSAELEARLTPRIDRLAANLDQLMGSLAETSGVLENTVWLNSDKIKMILDNFEATSENLKQMSRDLKRYPGRLFFEKPPEKINMEKKN